MPGGSARADDRETAEAIKARLTANTSTAAAFTTTALQICRERSDELTSFLTSPTRANPSADKTDRGRDSSTTLGAARLATLNEVRQLSAELFCEAAGAGAAGAVRTWPTPEAVEGVVDAVQAAFRWPVCAVLAARGLALAADDLFLHDIRNDFFTSTTSATTATAGAGNARVTTWTVTPPLNLKEAYQETFGDTRLGARHSNTFNVVSHVDATPNVRLLPNQDRHPVRVVTDFAEEIDAALRRLPTAAAVAALASTDHNPTPDHSDAAGVFGLHPLDQVAAWKAVTTMLAQAHQDGAQVAVVPELNLGPTHPGDVSLKPNVSPYLTLSGSRHHVTAEGLRVNEATLLVDGEAVLVHRKTQPVLGHTPEGTEAIDVGRGLILLASRSWLVATLICADVNDDTIVGLVKATRANLVLVASMTPELGFFHTSLPDIALRSQALVIWANDPRDWGTGVPTSMFIAPTRDDSLVSHTDALPQLRTHDWSPAGYPAV